jgi:hypothetical protein
MNDMTLDDALTVLTIGHADHATTQRATAALIEHARAMRAARAEEPELVAEFRRTLQVRAPFGTVDEFVSEFAVLARLDTLTAQLAEARRDAEEIALGALARVCDQPACTAAIVRADSGKRTCAAGHRVRWVDIAELDTARAERDEARRERDAIKYAREPQVERGHIVCDADGVLDAATVRTLGEYAMQHKEAMGALASLRRSHEAMREQRDTARAALAAMRARVLAVANSAADAAYDNATPECCGRPGTECCGMPERAWSAADEAVMKLAADVRAAVEGEPAAVPTDNARDAAAYLA